MEKKRREDDDRSKPEDKRRDRFAKAIAKAEFGRFYWDETRNGEVEDSARRFADCQRKKR